MSIKLSIFRVFGLGAFFEVRRVAHDELWKDRPALVGKIVVGPALINLVVPLGPWRMANPPF